MTQEQECGVRRVKERPPLHDVRPGNPLLRAEQALPGRASSWTPCCPHGAHPVRPYTRGRAGLPDGVQPDVRYCQLPRALRGAVRRHLDGPGRGPGSAWRRARLSMSLATACLASCGSGRGSMWRALAWGTRRAAVRRPRPCLTLTACSSVCLHQLFAALAVLTAGPQRTRPLCLAAPVCLNVCEAHQPAVDGSSSCICLVVAA